jgi:hypothetical protein
VADGTSPRKRSATKAKSTSPAEAEATESKAVKPVKGRLPPRKRVRLRSQIRNRQLRPGPFSPSPVAAKGKNRLRKPWHLPLRKRDARHDHQAAPALKGRAPLCLERGKTGLLERRFFELFDDLWRESLSLQSLS